jgi:hypothetical protein
MENALILLTLYGGGRVSYCGQNQSLQKKNRTHFSEEHHVLIAAFLSFSGPSGPRRIVPICRRGK